MDSITIPVTMFDPASPSNSINLGAKKMDDWNQYADKLEAALLENTPALMLHFLKTASPQQIEALASSHQIETGGKGFQTTKAVLATRLESSADEES